jgi:hypothetical protein
MQTALENDGHQVCPQFIWNRIVYATAVCEGLTVMEKEPDGKATKEIKALWKWLDKRLGHGASAGRSKSTTEAEAHC